MTPPLGSGPYKVGNLSAGRFIEYARVADYWGRDLPVNVGFYNFDVIRIDFFRERQVAFEAFKKGDITYREEFTSKTWAQEYNFPAVTDGRVVKTTFPGEAAPSLQGWFFNTRRPKFADPRTRLRHRARLRFRVDEPQPVLRCLYARSLVLPEVGLHGRGPAWPRRAGAARALRADLPPEVFGEPAYVPPKTDGSGRDRTMLRQAADLLADAGWRQATAGCVDEAGEALDIEFLIDASVFERVIAPFVAEPRSESGCRRRSARSTRRSTSARLNDFDFDNVLVALASAPRRSTGCRSSSARAPPTRREPATMPASRTRRSTRLLAGLPDVDSREQLTTVLKALDRVLRAGQYWIPNWYLAEHRVAHWDMFGWPAEKPAYAFTPETTWWFDRDKAAVIGKA